MRTFSILAAFQVANSSYVFHLAMALVLLSFNRPTCTAESEGITDRVMSRQIWKFFAMHLIIAAIYGV